MTTTLVVDTTCLINLQMVRLIKPMLSLPYIVVVPVSILRYEFLSITEAEKQDLVGNGLEPRELNTESMHRADELINEFRSLSQYDCYALCLALEIENTILLSGDRNLRKKAEEMSVDVHGVIWVVDELHRHNLVPDNELILALSEWLNDRSVYLPSSVLLDRISQLAD